MSDVDERNDGRGAADGVLREYAKHHTGDREMPFDKAGTYAVNRLEKETGDRVIGESDSDCQEAKVPAAKIDACSAIIDSNWRDTGEKIDARQQRAAAYVKSG